MATKQIFIVEDEVIVAMDIQRGLKRLGYTVLGISNNGVDALEKIKEFRPDLVLMDIQIQGELDGVQAAKQIWERFRTPVVFLTAYADSATLGRAKTAESFGYILKPFEERELHTAIEVALSKHRSVETEYEASSEALAQSEEKFKLFVNSVKDYSIIMLDPEGKVLSWNAGAEQIKGYKAEEVIGKHFSIFYSKDEIAKGAPTQCLKIAATQGSHVIEGWRARKNGSLFWASSVITALRDEKGVLRGFGKVVRDLTFRKQNEDALKESESRKAAILEASLDCIISMDHEGKVVDFNPAAERIFDRKREEVFGRDMADLIIPPRFRSAHRHGLAQYLATGKGNVLGQRIEMPALRKDGTEFLVELSITSLKLEGKQVFTGFLRDITEKKRLQASENAAKRRLKIQYEIMSVLSASKNLKEATPKLLEKIAKQLGWDVGLIWLVDEKDNLLCSLETWHPPHVNVPEFTKATRDWTFESGKGLPGRVWREGKAAWIQDVAHDPNFPRFALAEKEGLRAGFGFPILGERKIWGVVEFFSKEIRTLDEELLDTVTTLGRQIGQFMDRMATQEVLRQAVEARDEFLSLASHELKTPLTSLGLQLQLTRRGIKPETNTTPSADALAKSVSKSIKQVATLTHLVEELLDVSKIQRGILTLNLEKTDLTALIREVVDRFCEQLTSAKCKIELDLDQSITGNWDPHRIEQVLVNLISNIIKYAPGKPARIQLRAEGKTAILEIRDQGPGIPDEKQERIFERFERATSATNISGLGLGLYIVKRIVEAHQGRIDLESSLGLGSKFVIMIPLNPTLSSQGIYESKWR